MRGLGNGYGESYGGYGSPSSPMTVPPPVMILEDPISVIDPPQVSISSYGNPLDEHPIIESKPDLPIPYVPSTNLYKSPLPIAWNQFNLNSGLMNDPNDSGSVSYRGHSGGGLPPANINDPKADGVKGNPLIEELPPVPFIPQSPSNPNMISINIGPGELVQVSEADAAKYWTGQLNVGQIRSSYGIPIPSAGVNTGYVAAPTGIPAGPQTTISTPIPGIIGNNTVLDLASALQQHLSFQTAPGISNQVRIGSETVGNLLADVTFFVKDYCSLRGDPACQNPAALIANAEGQLRDFYNRYLASVATQGPGGGIVGEYKGPLPMNGGSNGSGGGSPPTSSTYQPGNSTLPNNNGYRSLDPTDVTTPTGPRGGSRNAGGNVNVNTNPTNNFSDPSTVGNTSTTDGNDSLFSGMNTTKLLEFGGIGLAAILGIYLLTRR